VRASVSISHFACHFILYRFIPLACNWLKRFIFTNSTRTNSAAFVCSASGREPTLDRSFVAQCWRHVTICAPNRQRSPWTLNICTTLIYAHCMHMYSPLNARALLPARLAQTRRASLAPGGVSGLANTEAAIGVLVNSIFFCCTVAKQIILGALYRVRMKERKEHNGQAGKLRHKVSRKVHNNQNNQDNDQQADDA
jgi:hypothetical protein